MAVSSRDQMQTPDRTSGVTFAGSIKVGGPLPVSWSDALEILQRERLVKRVKCVGFHMQQLFEGIEFSDKRVLDIGGGFGMASLFAAALGAREVICLEPGSAGSSQVTQFGLRSAARSEVTRRIDFLDATLQAYLQTEPVPFDVIISNNSINHLDEPACVRLLEPEGRKTYQDIFKAIRQITQPGGRFIVSDCCRHNALEQFGVRNPLRRSIEWEKHWQPNQWVELIEAAGFDATDLRWISLNSLGRLGAFAMNNQLIAWIASGAFRVTFTAR